MLLVSGCASASFREELEAFQEVVLEEEDVFLMVRRFRADTF
jgi:hypothetical protein